ncbi:MAG: lyase family protein [Actinomycetota bacterium]|nr:lyase family protein [Actinomycetota bacterium]
MSEGLFTRTHERGPVRDQVASRSWLQAMLDAEDALAGACAQFGVVPAEAAAAISSACADISVYDERELGILAERTGNPVLGLLAAIRETIPTEFARYVHYGATSQDIVDTAAMLVTSRAISALLPDLDGCANIAAALARRHRNTPMIARTLLQQAVPITFGLKAAQWLHGLGVIRAQLFDVQARLPAQLGGAAGSLDGYPDAATGLRIAEAFAARLGLAPARAPWHTLRYPIGEIAGGLATASGILGKIALDLVLLTQNEVAEITMALDRRGASSTMAHKRNPVSAVAARSAAKRAPGLAATLFAAMEQEHERAAGGWHAEWPTMSDLLSCVGSSAAWLHDALASVRVDERRTASNLAAIGSAAAPPDVGALIDRALTNYLATNDHQPQ